MKKVYYLTSLLFAALCMQKISAQDVSIFPKGEISNTDNHTGTIWLNELSVPDTVFNYSVAVATYAPGAKLDWHIHPAGQILLITEGTGYYQEKGKPIQLLRKGDVVNIPPDIVHWHGASPDSKFTHIAINPNTQKGIVVWLERVTDEEYDNFK